MRDFPLLTVLTLVPLLAGIVLVGLPSDGKALARRLALIAALVSLALGGLLWASFDPGRAAVQLTERHVWIPTLGVEYFVGVDGLGLLLVLLTVIVVPMAILASWKIEERVPLYFALVLFLEAGLIGTFTALNFFHWFIFWELSLIPAFLLIKLWGGPDRSFAATQFFIYTMVGSVTMLLGFLALYYA
ncbi:MAG: NADH-quinone oxidoreductase subunit M, partial [Verrucomicrobia bacterium]|nr:NADH-quinone oxidoreductase subunit M [Verrucomicrobiota bacterium]